MNEFENIPNKGLDNLPVKESPVPSHLDKVEQGNPPKIVITDEENFKFDVWTFLEKSYNGVKSFFSTVANIASKGYEVIKSIQDIKTTGYLAVGVLILIIIVIILVKVL